MMEPAATVIDALGGPTKIAQMLGLNRISVIKWKRTKAAGGRGGVIPLRHHRAILIAAEAAGRPEITAMTLLPIEQEAAE